MLVVRRTDRQRRQRKIQSDATGGESGVLGEERGLTLGERRGESCDGGPVADDGELVGKLDDVLEVDSGERLVAKEAKRSRTRENPNGSPNVAET